MFLRYLNSPSWYVYYFIRKHTHRNIKLGCLKSWKFKEGKVGKVKKKKPHHFVLKQEINFNKSTLIF